MDKKEIVTLRLRRAVSKDIGLASILLYVSTHIVEGERAKDKVAWTDGTRMFFADKFFELTDSEQVGVCIHEALHVAFRHVQRGMTLQEREGSKYAHMRWNWACDAVINNALSHSVWFSLPKDCVLPKHCLTDEELRKKPAEIWTAEEIYRSMKDRGVMKPIYIRVGYGGKQDGKGEEADGTWCDLDPEEEGRGAKENNDPHDRHVGDAIWRERLMRAAAGTLPGSILRRMSQDMPTPRVEWEKVLRNFITARCMPTTENSWNRPSRRTLSQGFRASWVEAGIERQRGIKRCGIVIDTSGSIDDEILQIFVGEINGIMSKTGCEVVLVDCDADVQQVTVHRTPIRNHQAKGGGGTDFRPAITELEKYPIDVAVYLTDLCGTFPDKAPPFPLLWCATMDLDVPFGRKVLIPKD